MSFWSVKENVIGLERAGPHLRGAHLELKEGSLSLKRLFSFENGVGSCQEKEAVCVSAMDTEEVLLRPLALSVNKEKDIAAVFDFQVEPIFPFPPEQGIADWTILQKDKAETRLAVSIVQNVDIEAHLDALHLYGIDPEKISSIPTALAILIDYLMPGQTVNAIIYLGEQTTSCLLAQEGKAIAAHSIPIGASHLREKRTNTSLHETALSLCREIVRTIYALTSTKGKKIALKELFITGAFDDFHQLKEGLSDELKLPLVPLSQEGWLGLDGAAVQRYAVSLGLALSGFSHAPSSPNFRRKKFLYPHPWKRFKKPLIAYFSLMTLLAISCYGFGIVLLREQENQLRENYKALVGLTGKSYEEVEKELQLGDNSSESLSEISLESLKQRIYQLGTVLNNTPETFALAPQIPRVSDVMAWLATHPKVTVEDPVTHIRKGQIQVEDLHYSMRSYPTHKNSREHYQVQVEIEFTAASPTVAREFHDALMENQDLIDPKGEVKWNANKGCYRASFLLRDKTIYPREG